MAPRCAILALDGVADGPVALSFDVLGAARRVVRMALARADAALLTPRLVSLDGKPVRTAAGRRLEVDGALRHVAPRRGDVLLIPGLGMATPEEIARVLERDDVRLAMQAIRRASAKHALVAASCSATFVLGASGVVDGRRATTTWWLAPEFARRFPRVELEPERMVVHSGGTLTAGSAFAHVDLMLAIVARVSGPTVAALVSRYLLVDERPSQARYMIAQHLRTDDGVSQALERYVLRNLARPLKLAELARAVGTSPRTLARRVQASLGTTPQLFARRLRIERAAHLLQTTSVSIDEIARKVGWSDPAAFRREFRRQMGLSPREHRRATPA